MRLKYITLGIIILLCARSAHSAIDKREYADWNSYPFNQIVAFQHELPSGYGQDCTAQYVARDIILTARHCITKTNSHDNYTEKNKREYKIYLPNKTFTTDLVLEQYGYDTYNNDWALLRITNPDFYSTSPLNLDTATHIGNATSAGFGWMRVLNDSEIQTIRDHMNNRCVNIRNEYCTSGCNANCINSVTSLDDTNPDYTISYKKDNAQYTIRNIVNRLKKHSNCQITNADPDIRTHLDPSDSGQTHKYDSTCRIVSNDSGGLFINSSNKIQGIISSSVGDVFTPDGAYHNFPQPIESDLYNAYTAMLRASPSTTPTPETPSTTTPTVTPIEGTPTTVIPTTISTTPPSQPTTGVTSIIPTPETPSTATPTVTPIEGTPTTVIPTTISTTPPSQPTTGVTSIIPTPEMPSATPSDVTEIEEEIADIDKRITEAANKGNLTDEQTFDILVDLATYQELQQKLEKAKAREQSIPNKLLSGLTMAATGIGGQMLASGMAEQRADEAAERDMRAYLATFRCDYGQGRNIVGGETNIQLPGANELMQYTTEYKQLAASLKSAKEALGMMPGIESETVFDSATMNLYNNVSTGREQGAFTSLSQALLDKNSDDAKAWAEQTAAAHKKKNTGLTIGVAGAGAGLAGDIVINDILNKDKKSDNNTSQNSDISNIKNSVTAK